MNKKITLMLIALALLFYFVSYAFGEEASKIKFEEESFNFGNIKQGKVLTHIFIFWNEGNETLKIKNVRSSCGCTAALVSKKKIDPGKKGELKVVFNTKGYQGNVSKYVYVDSNDPKQPVKKLFIEAEIDVPPQPKITLDKYSLDVGLLLEGENIKARTKIMNSGELELRVNCSHKNAMFYSEGKKISFPLKIPSGKSVEIEIEIPSQKRKGLVREYVLIKSNDPNRQSLSFFFSGYIVSKLQLKELFVKYRDKLD
ncbi:MAG: DUF1573 domain-containing protein [Candidatus Aminicenantaceae bacterium]